MSSSSDFVEQIRARIAVSDVVSTRVKLKRRGREFVGLSPFNQEKTPSFTVNDQKGFYHCFSSGKSGDIFSFLMECEGLTFPEAVEKLARQAGLEPPAPSPQEAQKAALRNDLSALLERAAAFYRRRLKAADRSVRDYLQRRSLTAKTCEAFEIGFAPAQRSALIDHLQGEGVGLDAMREAGLIAQRDENDAPIDRFRGRLIFPIRNERGVLVGFGGRAMPDSPPGAPKYLNSPETPLFHKKRLLYNLHRVRNRRQKDDRLIVVEGYLDAIALDACGFAAVAPLGTALSEEHLALMWRFDPEPFLCFDGDAAGKRAARRAVDVVMPELKPDRSVHFIFLPQGVDPDDIVTKGGAEAFARRLDQARPLADVFIEREGLDALKLPEHRAGADARIEAAVAAIRDPLVRRRYKDHLWNVRRRRKTTKNHKIAALPPPDRPTGDPDHRLEIMMILTLLNHPGIIDEDRERIAAFEFNDPERAALLRALNAGADDDDALDKEGLHRHLEERGFASLLSQLEDCKTRLPRGTCFGSSLEPEEARRGWEGLCRLYHRKDLDDDLERAEKDLGDDRDAEDENLRRLRSLNAEKHAADKWGAQDR